MTNRIRRSRVIAAFLALGGAVGVYFHFAAEPQSAQQKGAVQKVDRFRPFAKSDAVTDAMRNASNGLFRVRVNGPDDRAKAARFGRIVEDYGSFVVIAKNRRTDMSGSGLESQKVETDVHLPGAKFDPIAETQAETVRADSPSRPDRFGYYIVQLGGLATDHWLDSIRDAGVEVLQYVPNQAFFVYGSEEAVSKIAGHSRVRWVGRYNAKQKLPPFVREHIIAAKAGGSKLNADAIEASSDGRAVFDIAVFARADVRALADDMQRLFSTTPARVTRLANNYFNIIRIEIDLDDVDAVAEIPEVVSISPAMKRQREDERAAQIVAGNYSSSTVLNSPGYDPLTQFGVDGTGVTVAVTDDGIGIPGDGGFYITSANAIHGPVRGAPSTANGHGHLNATIIAGDIPFSALDLTGYNYGKGIAPKAHIINIPILHVDANNNPLWTGTDADIYNDSITTTGPNGVNGFITNNSWGGGTNANVYGSLEAEWDGFVRDASLGPAIDPICIVFSAGNSSSSGLTRPKVAKNVIAVGNAENIRTELNPNFPQGFDNMDDLNSASSRGPAADGRVKPDITAPGTGITGGRSGSDVLFGDIDVAHRWSSGTSHAAPQVAGAAALFTQFWKNSHMGGNPSPALIKAAIINTAQEMIGNLTSAPRPNGNEGWGRINLKYMFDSAAPIKHINEEVAFSQVGSAHSIAGTVGDATKPVRVTLVWTDPPGVSDPALVNNLDLTVTIGSAVYKGNVFSNGLSETGGLADTKNNVENVFLPAGIPAGTPYTISITAAGLNGDGILGNDDTTDQHYALVAYNLKVTPPSGSFSVSGRVVTKEGRGVLKAIVTLTDGMGVTKTAITNFAGYYTFNDVPGPAHYTMSISRRMWKFAPQNITIAGNIEAVNFVSISAP